MAINGHISDIPPVVLDTTLRDLLGEDQHDGEQIESFCALKPNSDASFGRAVPFNDKYIIHSAQVGNGDDLAHLQLEICNYLLMFFAGRMNALFVACEGETEDETLYLNVMSQSAGRSFAVINEDQRPKVITFASPSECIEKYQGPPIRWAFAIDFAQHLPHLFHPDLTYKLNSKRWLAACKLKSASDHIIDCEIAGSSNQDGGRWFYDGSNDDKDDIEKEVERVRQILEDRPLPFVLKLTQSLSAVGTNIVKTEKERKELITYITHYLHDYLPRITQENRHLYTTSLILSDFIAGPTMALNLYVRRDGSVVFLGACHQLATGQSGRQATAITYADQSALEKKYADVLQRVADELHKEGYYGPVGTDVMEDPDDGTLFVIDANVRVPLSLVLYLLKGHFSEKRGYGVSLVTECIIITVSREELEKRFAKELREARMILLGSTRLGGKKQWAFGMVVAGETKKEIDDINDRLADLEVQDEK